MYQKNSTKTEFKLPNGLFTVIDVFTCTLAFFINSDQDVCTMTF